MAKTMTINLSNEVLESAGKPTSSGKSELLVTENVSFEHEAASGKAFKIRIQYFVYRTELKEKASSAPKKTLVKLS